ncbi:MAG: protein-L-isoaspartate O-methyltransferase [Betaproteobacteria bacterium]|nr:protein-L-isoaspartate O-methyltransferase [Betaproteobacteria bacterium]
MDYEQTRFNMVEQQIRPWEVLDLKVLDLLFQIKREDYVPAVYQSLAFVDMEIPLGHGESMWAPKIEARALQAVQIQPNERVLEVGTGSGYLTALLAAQALMVVTVELHVDLKEEAERRFKAHGLGNVQTRQGDAARDWDQDGAFDVIVVTGSLALAPEQLLQRLNPNGRLFAVVGEGVIMSARLYTNVGGGFRMDSLFETRIKALENAPVPERFEF